MLSCALLTGTPGRQRHQSRSQPSAPALNARQLFTADDVIDEFGVAKGSYDLVPLPNIRAYQVGRKPVTCACSLVSSRTLAVLTVGGRAALLCRRL